MCARIIFIGIMLYILSVSILVSKIEEKVESKKYNSCKKHKGEL